MGVARTLRRGVRNVARAAIRATSAGVPKGPHVWRYAMYERLGSVLTDADRDATRRVLSVSHSTRLVRVMGLDRGEIVEADYPEHDVLDLGFADGSFDAVVSDQVLEHLDGDPQRAFDECRRVLRPGGLSVHTTCFVQHRHWGPKDMWRFSTDALAYLARDHAEIIELGAWGNPYIWPYIVLGLRHEPVPHARWHPVNKLARYNHPMWPATTWVVARA